MDITHGLNRHSERAFNRVTTMTLVGIALFFGGYTVASLVVTSKVKLTNEERNSYHLIKADYNRMYDENKLLKTVKYQYGGTLNEACKEFTIARLVHGGN
jgi:hypothetical protein